LIGVALVQAEVELAVHFHDVDKLEIKRHAA
jgi:hypothetical protein